MRPGGPPTATGRSDAGDRLIEAEEPLAALQRRCGGEIPGIIAAPALLELVRKARRYGLRLAQTVRMQDDHDEIVAWVEVTPQDGGRGGCLIALARLQATALADEDPASAIRRKAETDRQIAELWARLDSKQNLLTAHCIPGELEPLAERMQAGLGQFWADYVEVDGMHHQQQPLHWRLLDGARVTLPGSARSWTMSLAPVGGEPGAGFELFFFSDQPPPSEWPAAQGQIAGEPTGGATIGQEIAPVLRQPIARIISNAETIRARLAGPIAEEYSNYAADIAAAGEHLLSIIDDLADFEAVEAEDFTTAVELIDLADLARRAAAILCRRAEEANIALDAPDHDEVLPALGNSRRVMQVLFNLIGNAISYSPPHSQIWVRVAREGDGASVTVADQGQGLSGDEQAAIFEKFERLGRSGDGGSGLGLYISRKLAYAMGGELTVESAPGKGARFKLTLTAAE